ncbi:MAG: TonB-dependent receptor [Elusimicrobia bacterium]|nr:MAG: TonB-dependent receptor [Elusimicrobiota bacterium]
MNRVFPCRCIWPSGRFWARAVGLSLPLLVLAATAIAQMPDASTDGDAGALPLIVVSATRNEEPELDVPASVSVIDAGPAQTALPGSGLARWLSQVPGLVAQDRLSYAQDLQISLRGFGARASFGVRGIQILLDGLPLTLPDGQSQTDPINLLLLDRIEVLRGPTAVMYGNAAGGVIQLFSANAPSRTLLDAGIRLGSDATREEYIRTGGQSGPLDYLASISNFSTSGFRDHSSARRDHFYGKVRYRPDESSSLTFILNAEDQPFAEDPSSLNAGQLAEDPRQAVARVFQYDAGETHRHRQGGLVYERELGDQDHLQATLWSASRRVIQFLPFSGDEPLSSGAVVDLDSASAGASLHWSRTTRDSALPRQWTAGFDFQRLHETRKGFVNADGIKGALARDEQDSSSKLGVFAQWRLGIERWHLDAGIRHSRVAFDVDDRFVNAFNPDDSGQLDYSRTTAFAGPSWRASSTSNLYLSFGKGFETPSFAELAYRPDGQNGLNFELKPSTSRHVEAGYKANPSNTARIRLAAFSIESDNEILTASNVDGRSTFRNAGGTTRKGLELGLDGKPGENLEATLAWSLLIARFSSGPLSGSRLPGIPRSTLFGSLHWENPDSGLHASVDALWRGRMFADDANLHEAGGSLRLGLELGKRQRWGNWFLRLDNALDRSSVGAVVVNSGNGRYFQPATDRTILIGFNLQRD